MTAKKVMWDTYNLTSKHRLPSRFCYSSRVRFCQLFLTSSPQRLSSSPSQRLTTSALLSVFIFLSFLARPAVPSIQAHISVPLQQVGYSYFLEMQFAQTVGIPYPPSGPESYKILLDTGTSLLVLRNPKNAIYFEELSAYENALNSAQCLYLALDTTTANFTGTPTHPTDCWNSLTTTAATVELTPYLNHSYLSPNASTGFKLANQFLAQNPRLHDWKSLDGTMGISYCPGDGDNVACNTFRNLLVANADANSNSSLVLSPSLFALDLNGIQVSFHLSSTTRHVH